MGTRHLVCIYHNGRIVIAQYGQLDGYPEEAGMAVLRFLLIEGNIKRLRDNIHLAPPPPNSETETDAHIMGAAILEEVATASETIRHSFELDFANDSLFCEWAYVVDLDDAGALEVYQGGRFRGRTLVGRLAEAGIVWQTLRAKFAFDKLPGGEDEFVEACYADGEEERKLRGSGVDG
jgi:hypothetical protein